MSQIENNTLSNPAPLGLLGFGLTTVLLNFTNAGLIPFSSIILSMGIFYGGLAQVIAGIMEYKKGNTFGQTAFISYGFFWISLVGLLWLPKAGFDSPTNSGMALYLGLWGLFTFGMFIASLTHNFITKFIFGSLTILFVLLALGHITGNSSITVFAGYEGIICGLSAIYSALAQVINESYGRSVLPM